MKNLPNTDTSPDAEPKIKFDFGEKDTVLFALEGTLADHKHRLDLRMNASWKAYYEEADKDTVSADVLAVLHGLMGEFCVLIYTTRPISYKRLTFDWLKRNNIYPDGLLMRDADQTGSDETVKIDIILKELGTQKGQDITNAIKPIVSIFENDHRTAVALRNLGFTVFTGN